MSEPIYFSKVEFVLKERFFTYDYVTLLDIPQKELSYQVLKWEWRYPERKIKSGKTGFEPVLLREEKAYQKVIFSYGIRLSDEQMQELLPYCNALDFEPYRGKTMSEDDEGAIGYLDELMLSFTGITNSYIPKMECWMGITYDYEHRWPHDKLYDYLLSKFFRGNKALKGYYPLYNAPRR